MVGMHIHIIPNRNSTPAVLLRESYRVGGNVRKRTLANLSKLPMDAVDAIRRILKGEKLVSVEVAFKIVENGSRHHGHVDAVLSAMRQLGFEKLVGSRHSPERDLVVAMVVTRILEPQSKLATSQWWHTTTLPEILGVSDAREDDLYAAMDWVLKRQEVIEKKLAARHLHNDGLALYDLTSSYFEGASCPIARLGYDRDGKKGKLQINYGLLTNERGIPVSVSVFEGNTGDPKTLLPQVEKVQERFGIEQFVVVGDRGMITQTQIDELREMDGVDWITALRPEPIRKLINDGVLQMGLFDERNLSRQLRTRNSREPTTCSKVSPCRQKPAPLIPTISLDQHRILAFSARNFSLASRVRCESSSSARVTACARAAASPGGTKKPSIPSRTISRMGPISAATQTQPRAIASINASPRPSNREGKRNTSQARSKSGTSRRGPRKCTRSLTPRSVH